MQNSKRFKPKHRVSIDPQDYGYEPIPQYTDSRIEKNSPNKSFTEDLEDFVSAAIIFIQGIAKAGFLLGLVVSAAFVDVVLGSLALGVAFQNNMQIGNVIVGTGTIATMVSIFTSGLQIFLMSRWREIQKRLTWWNWTIMIGIMVLDTFIDLTVPGYLMYGENILTINLVGKPAGYYIVMIIVGAMCAFSENIIVAMSDIIGKKK